MMANRILSHLFLAVFMTPSGTANLPLFQGLRMNRIIPRQTFKMISSDG
ncbi:hypothetical protein ACVMH6_006277 [Rhizobium leguminosarum]